MDAAAVSARITTSLPGVQTTEAYGYTFFFVGDERVMPFATLTGRDNEHDAFSNLSRGGLWRLNLGVEKATFLERFGAPPALGPTGVIEPGHDWTQRDVLLPHPQYAPQSWVCIVSPSDATFESTALPLLAEAHALAARRQARKEG